MKRFTLILLVCVSVASGSQANAQQSIFTNSQLGSLALRNSAAGFTPDVIQRRIVNQSVPQQYFTPVNYSNFFNSTRSAGPTRAKPFSALANSASVTPYLALSEPFSSSAHNYYTQVRPQLEQQRINQQMQQRAMRMQQQLSTMAAQPPYSPTGNQAMAPTGHAAVYMNYGGYYPIGGPQQQRR